VRSSFVWNEDGKFECLCGGLAHWRDCTHHEDDTVCFAIQCPMCLEMESDCED